MPFAKHFLAISFPTALAPSMLFPFVNLSSTDEELRSVTPFVSSIT